LPSQILEDLFKAFEDVKDKNKFNYREFLLSIGEENKDQELKSMLTMH